MMAGSRSFRAILDGSVMGEDRLSNRTSRVLNQVELGPRLSCRSDPR